VARRSAVVDAANVENTNASNADAVLAASRAFVALAARSLGPVESVVSLMQWRALVVISADSQGTLGALAAALGVHPSTATRLVDRLVSRGLLRRRERQDDRRYLSLSLTPKAERLVEQVTSARRRDIEQILEHVDASRREPIARALLEFAAAFERAQLSVAAPADAEPSTP
jgi:DNA-binding MarR family transcriptional regulator